ncbi:MAG: hypothetical protein D3921_12475 [Candidatus Electrothrix sp. AW1]|nr:hypothetical protein [Candidatus Electrothrix sp. AX1]MCI5183305.1 hypothetical protein [Candidatus Electrothrix gigas]
MLNNPAVKKAYLGA